MRSLRPLKLGLGLTALFAGVYAVMADQHYVTSNTAVVSSYVTSIRVPRVGTLDLSRLRTGAEVRQGQVLASVDNALFDRHHLYDLTAQRNIAASAAQRPPLIPPPCSPSVLCLRSVLPSIRMQWRSASPGRPPRPSGCSQRNALRSRRPSSTCGVAKRSTAPAFFRRPLTRGWAPIAKSPPRKLPPRRPHSPPSARRPKLLLPA